MRSVVFTIFLFFCAHYLHAIQVSIHTSTFYSGNQPYVDVGFRILAGGLTFKESEDKKLTASAGVTITIMDSTGQFVVAWEKYRLIASDLTGKKDLIDQRRFALSPGNFILKMDFQDEQSEGNSFGVEKKMLVLALNKPSFSTVNLITAVQKKDSGPFVYNGYYMEPFAFDIVNETSQILHFYSELYTTLSPGVDTTATGIFRFAVCKEFEPSDSSRQILVKYKKLKLNQVVPLSGFFDLNKLVSGDYHLEIAQIDEHKKVIVRGTSPFINRNFPADVANVRNYNNEVNNSFVGKLDSAQLFYSIKSLASQVATEETAIFNYTLSNQATLDVRRYYLFKFWKDRYPVQPESAFEGYMKVVKALDNQFYSAFGNGHQSDRGYVFLKYGKPNKVMSVDDEANTPPYEIWYYDHVSKTSQNNVRFIFYSPMLANEYELLHSTCRGERSNKQWEIQLYKNSKSEAINPGIDATEMGANWNRKARKLFEEQ